MSTGLSKGASLRPADPLPQSLDVIINKSALALGLVLQPSSLRRRIGSCRIHAKGGGLFQTRVTRFRFSVPPSQQSAALMHVSSSTFYFNLAPTFEARYPYCPILDRSTCEWGSKWPFDLSFYRSPGAAQVGLVTVLNGLLTNQTKP